ncbi:MAG: hypothetical protein C5B49_09450 [Bdellovibrio sp.]|nr:MAG: hypothetical protein C5B49_09450 [Bdellovibrio sp.]
MVAVPSGDESSKTKVLKPPTLMNHGQLHWRVIKNFLMSRNPIMRELRRAWRLAEQELNPSPLDSAEVPKAPTWDLELQRRSLLKHAAAVGLLLPAGSLLSACSHKTVQPSGRANSKSNGDVVIIGAGIAGLTAAYELGKSGISCRIFEASNRLGGRMYTLENFNSDGMTCDLGGELIDTDHTELRGLCKELHVPVGAFASEDQGRTPNLYYFDGRYRTNHELVEAAKKIVPRFEVDKAKPASWWDQQTLAQYLKSLPMDPWVLRFFQVAYASEYGLDAEELSALNFLWMFELKDPSVFSPYGESDETFRIIGGNIQLMRVLAKAIESQGSRILLNRPMIRINEKDSDLQLDFDSPSGTQTVHADRVILTLPFSVLRNIEGVNKLNLHPLKSQMIQEMSNGNNSKIILGFSDRYWHREMHQGKHRAPASTGYFFTDLPIQTGWDCSRLQSGKSGILCSYSGGSDALSLRQRKISDVLAGLDRVFPGVRKIYDGNSAAMDWISSPLSRGSYMAFRPGQSTRFGKIAGKPELGGKLLFAGEHTARKSAGFMNGACVSGLDAARSLVAEVQGRAPAPAPVAQ